MGSPQMPHAYPEANWVITSPELQAELEIADSELSSTWLPWCSGQRQVEGAEPIAQKYTGHQFGRYNPDLGDGRGVLLGEVATQSGRWDVHVKGCGKTPYSRFGDGRAVLRSCIREFLASEALFHLGIPTSRALGVFLTGEQVQREIQEPGAALVRVCKSHIRFGHFEYAFYQQNTDLLERLVNYCAKELFPELKLGEASNQEQALAVFNHIISSTAELAAKWQAFGFCHGVMNTDNMSVLGITFDFGPYGFLDEYNPKHICNQSDHSGRYAFDEQLGVALWNLNALGHALSPILTETQIRDALQQYEPKLLTSYSRLARQKLGFVTERDDDRQILGELLALMQKDQRDHTNTWRLLTELNPEQQSQQWTDHFISRQAAQLWMVKYQQRCELDGTSLSQRQAMMQTVNPKYILRNYLAQQAIESAEQGDLSPLTELFNVLKQPYTEQDGCERFAKSPPDWAKSLNISCSS